MDTKHVIVFLTSAVLLAGQYASGLDVEAFPSIEIPENQKFVTKINITDNDGDINFSFYDPRFEAELTDMGADINMKTSMDYEEMSVNPFMLNFSVSDNSNSKYISMVVTVLDSNDPPVFNPYQIERGGFSIDATASVGFVAGTIVATDQDWHSPPNGDVKYEIVTPVNITYPFAIDDAGTVTVARSTDFRLTDRKVWPLTILAIDGGTPPLSASIIIPVNVCGACEVYDEL